VVLGSNNTTKDRNWLPVLVTFVLSIFLIIISSIGWSSGLRSALSYILDPIYITSSNIAISINEYISTLTNISEFRNEYNQMKMELAQYKIDIVNYQSLKNENYDLKTQLELQNSEYVYVYGKILDHMESESLIINVGLQDGVTKGDIAVLGSTFIGIVVECNQYTSSVRLPISKSSFLETYIISADETDSRNILSRAVINGSSDGIRIENIGMNSGVKNGDIVIVNDSKVGDNLVLGHIVGLSEDPATTTRSGYVSPVIDYYDLLNLFIRLKDVD